MFTFISEIQWMVTSQLGPCQWRKNFYLYYVAAKLVYLTILLQDLEHLSLVTQIYELDKPTCFQSKCKGTTVIFDVTEKHIEKPSTPETKPLTF